MEKPTVEEHSRLGVQWVWGVAERACHRGGVVRGGVEWGEVAEGEVMEGCRQCRGSKGKVQTAVPVQNDHSGTVVETGREEGKTGQEHLVRRPVELGDQ